MRSLLFNIYYYVYSTSVIILGLPLLFWPSRKPLVRWVHLWAKAMVWGMRVIAGINVEVRGLEHRPTHGTVSVIAPKHQSWCDGIIMMALVPDVAALATAELRKFPFVRHIVKKIGVILVKECGGIVQRNSINDGARAAVEKARSILIYPEGRLVPVGEAGPYKPGVYHMYADLNVPVVPVATNVGLHWPGRSWRKKPGQAIIEFLAPIAPGKAKAGFMAELEGRIEHATQQLIAEVQNVS